MLFLDRHTAQCAVALAAILITALYMRYMPRYLITTDQYTYLADVCAETWAVSTRVTVHTKFGNYMTTTLYQRAVVDSKAAVAPEKARQLQIAAAERAKVRDCLRNRGRAW
jgi:hypothetical protein